MSNTLAVPENKHVAALYDRAKEYARQSRAENTLLTYAKQWRHFEGFCRTIGADPLPCLPVTVCAYLTHLSKEKKASTLKTKLAAIAFRHRTAGLPDPTKDEAVKLTLDGIRRTRGTATERKAAVSRDLLEQMLSAQPDDLRGTRNRAMLLVNYACDLRRSELVALTIADVKFLKDRMVVTIRRSKTDQAGQGYEINVPRLNSTLCPVRALKTWLDVAHIKTGPLFRKVDHWEHVGQQALTDQVVARIVKQSANAIGIDASQFAGHSLRRGLITQAALNEEQTADIRKVSRHKTEIMIDAYRADTARAQLRVIRRALED